MPKAGLPQGTANARGDTVEPLWLPWRLGASGCGTSCVSECLILCLRQRTRRVTRPAWLSAIRANRTNSVHTLPDPVYLRTAHTAANKGPGGSHRVSASSAVQMYDLFIHRLHRSHRLFLKRLRRLFPFQKRQCIFPIRPRSTSRTKEQKITMKIHGSDIKYHR